MKQKKETILCGVLCALLAMSVSACAGRGSMDVIDYPIEHELEFGGAYIKLTIADFLGKGYDFGDSVRVEFSNGYVMEDLPFYNGYYVPFGDPLMVGYPGYPYIKVANNSDVDLWTAAGLSETDTASVYLNEKGKYSYVMDVRGLDMVTDPDAFESEELFANFRSLKGGHLKENLLYRSSSPIDDTYGKAAAADRLCEEAGIKLAVNLSDSPETVQNHLETDGAGSLYYRQLYEEGHVLLPQISISYGSEDVREKVAAMFTEMIEYEGPYLLHCALGKDRSGFVSILLEMMAGASYEEILDDYMLSYESFYLVTESSAPEKYKAIIDETFTVMMRSIVTDPAVSLTDDGLAPYAEEYLLSGGMSEETLAALKEIIMK